MYCDGMGAIFTSHRNARRSEHERMQEALALDSSWDPDLSLLESGAPELAFRKAWIAAAKRHVELWFGQIEQVAGSNPDEAYYHRRASAFWREVWRSGIGGVSIWHFAFSESVAHEVWANLREQGVIGAKDLVMLDCYEHGGQSWSISGTRHSMSLGHIPVAQVLGYQTQLHSCYSSSRRPYTPSGTSTRFAGSWQVSLMPATPHAASLYGGSGVPVAINLCRRQEGNEKDAGHSPGSSSLPYLPRRSGPVQRMARRGVLWGRRCYFQQHRNRS